MAQEWFEPGITGELDEVPDWINNWNLFIDELQTNFGPYDQVGDVERALVNLRMKDNQQISEYLVRFNSLSSQCQWGEPALRHHFYDGLPSRLKDEITKGKGKPRTLSEMQQKARNADARYWEHIQEWTQEQSGKQAQQKPQQQQTTGTTSTSSRQTPSRSTEKPTDTKSGTSGSSPVKPTTLASLSKSKLSGKLDSKGKLTPQERQHRISNNLCMYCGASGHKANDCPLSKSAKSKAACASGTGSKPTDPAAEQKKG